MRFTIESEEWHNVLKAGEKYRDEGLIHFKDSGLLMRLHDHSNTALYSCFIPEDVFDVYDTEDEERLGIHIDTMKDITPSTKQELTMTWRDYTLKQYVNDRVYTAPDINPDMVSGVPEQVPEIEFPISITTEPDWFMDFIKESYSYVFNGGSGSFFMSAQEGLLYLWSKKDDSELAESKHWEDLEDYNIDWKAASPAEQVPIKPTKEKRQEIMMAVGLTRNMVMSSDTIRIDMGHGLPLKVVSESESGVMHSWLVPPKFPTSSDSRKIPDRIIKDRGVT